MLRILALSVMMVFGLASAAVANELDNESSVTNEQVRWSKDLPATVVVRTNLATGKAEVLHLNEELGESTSSQESVLARSGDFREMAATDRVSGKTAGELDRDSSSSSWYFYFYNYSYNYPTYYYSGYNYRYYPYYNYWWGGYAYSYYRWYW